MTTLRKTTWVNARLINDFRDLFEKIAEILNMNLDELEDQYLANIENKLRNQGEHELANNLYL